MKIVPFKNNDFYAQEAKNAEDLETRVAEHALLYSAKVSAILAYSKWPFIDPFIDNSTNQRSFFENLDMSFVHHLSGFLLKFYAKKLFKASF